MVENKRYTRHIYTSHRDSLPLPFLHYIFSNDRPVLCWINHCRSISSNERLSGIALQLLGFLPIPLNCEVPPSSPTHWFLFSFMFNLCFDKVETLPPSLSLVNLSLSLYLSCEGNSTYLNCYVNKTARSAPFHSKAQLKFQLIEILQNYSLIRKWYCHILFLSNLIIGVV